MNLGPHIREIESDGSEIIRMFYTEFDSLLPKEKQGLTFYPAKFAKQIDEVNDWVYDTVNNGYRIESKETDCKSVQMWICNNAKGI
jgi:glutathionyl-hydroquinone reductase